MPVCVWARASVCMVGARVGAARHVGSHGWAAPGPDLTRWWVPGGGGGGSLPARRPRLSPVRGQSWFRCWHRRWGYGGWTSPYLCLLVNAHKPGSPRVVFLRFQCTGAAAGVRAHRWATPAVVYSHKGPQA